MKIHDSKDTASEDTHDAPWQTAVQQLSLTLAVGRWDLARVWADDLLAQIHAVGLTDVGLPVHEIHALLVAGDEPALREWQRKIRTIIETGLGLRGDA